MAALIYNPGQPDEACFTIGDAAVTIGRADDQTICIPHKSLSRSHARIEPSGGRFVVVDLGSKNGTLVNGVRVQRREVHHGDTITLGDLALLFRAEPPSRPSAPGAAPAIQPQATRALVRAPIAKLAGEAGLRDAEARAHGRLKILIEVAKLLPVSEDVDLLLRKILDLVFQILDVDRGAILLVDEATGRLEPRVVKTSLPSADGRPIYSQNIVDYVLRHSVAALFADAVSDPRLPAARSVVLQSIRASMCVPLKPKDDVIGVLYVDNLRSTHLFTEDDLDFLVAFASQAAVALENATLYRRLEQETVARMQLIMEAKLAALSSMVAGIAHELRNPLNFMINFADLSAGLASELAEGLRAHRDRPSADALEEMDDLLGTLRDNTTRIREHGRRADAIIQSMLAHGRRPPGSRAATDLNALVAESVRLARGGVLGRGFELRLVEAYDPAVGLVELAPLDMSRVFLNVAENALYAMLAKKRARGDAYQPELRVRTAARGDHVEVRVRDDGTGIAAEALAKIFEPFFTTKPAGQGTGLGLSLSYEIVVQGHQGTMRVESEVGAWTEIVVTLPRQAERASRAP